MIDEPKSMMLECKNYELCRSAWSKGSGVGWSDVDSDELSDMLGCCSCELYEDGWAVPFEMSGVMRPATKILEGDGIVGSCKCSSCGRSVSMTGRYCKWCGVELVGMMRDSE